MINLQAKTSIEEIASLARYARIVIGGDTGPMHIAAATGTPVIMLFSKHSLPPALCAPRGEHVHIIKQDDLSTLSEEIVIEKIGDCID